VKKTIITLTLFVLIPCALGNQKDPVSEAQALLAQKEYIRAFHTLNQALGDETLSPLQRAQVLKAQAEFYEEFVGDSDRALGIYKEILETELPADHLIKSSADKEITRLESLEQRYSEQNVLLEKAQIAASSVADKETATEQVALLRNFIRNNPGYYKLTDVYYYLGLNYMALGKYGKSCRLFEKCTQLKPAIDFYLPVETYFSTARMRWAASVVTTTAWSIVGVLLIFTVFMFYTSRPWQWIRPGHLVLGLVMVLLWWAIFSVSYKLLAGSFQIDEETAHEMGVELPCFINTVSGTLSYKVVKYLFLYGLVGTLGVFVFSIGASRLKHSLAKLLINSLFGLLLFASLSTVFYMRHCYQQSRFNPGTGSKFSCLDGHLYFRLAEPEVYVLTNPRAYPNLKTSESAITDSDFREWVKQYCPFPPRPGQNHGSEDTGLNIKSEE
jgi:tetratricopeptide (TPR) repeat protein